MIMSTSTSKSKKLPVRTAENASEFGRAGKGARLICTAFHKQLKDIKDGTQNSRLISKLTQIIQSDPLNGRGKRTIAAGDISLLEGFDFCIKKQLLRTFHVQPAIKIDRERGLCTLRFPSFTPMDEVSTKGNITHILITAAAAELDFDKERFVTSSQSSEFLPLHEPVNCTLQFAIPAGSRLPIVLAIGIRLLQVINGEPYEMKQGGKLALQVVKAEIGSPKSEAGSPKLKTGDRKTKTGGKPSETKSRIKY